MKKFLVSLMVMAIAMTGLFATDATVAPEFKVGLSATIDSAFTVYTSEGKANSVPDSVTNISSDQSFTDAANGGKEFVFTVMWDMVTSKDAPTNTVSIEVGKLSNTAAGSSDDTIVMTATTSDAFLNATGTASVKAADAITVGSTTPATIVSFDSVSKVETKGGIVVTLGVTDAAFKEATPGASYQTTVKLTATVDA